jgi:hypothetical protein
MKEIPWKGDLPTCDLCKQHGRPNIPASYDSPWMNGSWANMCETHFSAGGNRTLASKRVAPKDPSPQKEPSLKTLQSWLGDGVAEATDGCRVEPDGTCPHGEPSWFLKLGII